MTTIVVATDEQFRRCPDEALDREDHGRRVRVAEPSDDLGDVDRVIGSQV